jgi:hypothetical protein
MNPLAELRSVVGLPFSSDTDIIWLLRKLIALKV